MRVASPKTSVQRRRRWNIHLKNDSSGSIFDTPPDCLNSSVLLIWSIFDL